MNWIDLISLFVFNQRQFVANVVCVFLKHSSQSGLRYDETSNDGSLIVDDSGPVDSSGN